MWPSSIVSDPVRDAQQCQRVRRWFRIGAETGFDLVPGHRAVACVIVWCGSFHLVEDWPADLHRRHPEWFLYAVCAVVTRATLDRLDLRARNQLEHVAGLEP